MRPPIQTGHRGEGPRFGRAYENQWKAVLRCTHRAGAAGFYRLFVQYSEPFTEISAEYWLSARPVPSLRRFFLLDFYLVSILWGQQCRPVTFDTAASASVHPLGPNSALLLLFCFHFFFTLPSFTEFYSGPLHALDPLFFGCCRRTFWWLCRKFELRAVFTKVAMLDQVFTV